MCAKAIKLSMEWAGMALVLTFASFALALLAISSNAYAATSSTSNVPTVKLKQDALIYNGKVQHPKVIVKDAKGKAIPESKYSVEYSKGCKNAGTYKAICKIEDGKYKGTYKCSFTITKGAMNRKLYDRWLTEKTFSNRKITKYDITGNKKKDAIRIKLVNGKRKSYGVRTKTLKIYINGKLAYTKKNLDTEYSLILYYIRLSNGTPFLCLYTNVYRYIALDDVYLLAYSGSKLKRKKPSIEKNDLTKWGFESLKASDNKIKMSFSIQYSPIGTYSMADKEYAGPINYAFKFENGKLTSLKGEAGQVERIGFRTKSDTKLYKSPSLKSYKYRLDKNSTVWVKDLYVRGGKLCAKVATISAYLLSEDGEKYYSMETGWINIKKIDTSEEVSYIRLDF